MIELTSPTVRPAAVAGMFYPEDADGTAHRGRPLARRRTASTGAGTEGPDRAARGLPVLRPDRGVRLRLPRIPRPSHLARRTARPGASCRRARPGDARRRPVHHAAGRRAARHGSAGQLLRVCRTSAAARARMPRSTRSKCSCRSCSACSTSSHWYRCSSATRPPARWRRHWIWSGAARRPSSS